MNRFQKIVQYYNWGGRFVNDPVHFRTKKLNEIEVAKTPARTDLINNLLCRFKRDTIYLEIGVRNPDDNFNKIKANTKYSVDPGLEFEQNPVDFVLTSDQFFEQLRKGKVLTPETKFDVIFIDGLHLAEQVYRDILNALDFITDDGFIVLHDCNPPSEWHARESYEYQISPAMSNWNGTTWKAYVKARDLENVHSCCIDSDWGVGVLTRSVSFGGSTRTIENPFFEFQVMDADRKNQLNLISFEVFKEFLKKL